MELELPTVLQIPTWPKLEKLVTEKIGTKFCKISGYSIRSSVNTLKTYFSEVFNPMITKDFKEQGQIVFQNGKLHEG
jgi:hypothetical protein